MINCKFCQKKFGSVSKFERHIRLNKCNNNSVAKKKKDGNKKDKSYQCIVKHEKKDLQPSTLDNINFNKLNLKNNNSNSIIQSSNVITKIHQCKYCNKIYKYPSGLSRHVKNCVDKKALEHFLGDKLKEKNMSLDEFIELRDMHQNNHQVITQQVINNNVINNNTTNVQINMINPFGKENVEHILKNKDLCMQILKKMDNGVNKLFLEVYNKDENRNFYKIDKTGKKIATLTKENRINHNEYEYVIEHIFSRMHSLYNKISENLKSICTNKVNSCISNNMHKHEISGLINSNKKTFDDYLNYMSKMNEDLITNMLVDNGYITPQGIPQLDV